MKYLLTALFLLFLIPASWAQLVIEYYTDPESIEIIEKEIFSGTVHSGLIVLPGDVVTSGKSYVEFRSQDSSIFLLDNNTRIKVGEILSVDDTIDRTVLLLQSGKMRMVAAEDSLPYQVLTAGHVVESSYGEVFIESRNTTDLTVTAFSGNAFVTSPDGEVREILPKTRYQNGAITTPPNSQLLQEFRGFPFRWLTPQDVRGYVDPFTIQQQITTAQAAPQEEEDAENKEKKDPKERFFRLHASAGTLINGSYTYGSFTLAPTWKSENFTLAFMAPLTFRGDISSPENFYHPAGNNEWSFGSDQNWQANTLDAIFDVINDSLLKVKELRLFTPQSRFYLQMGHIQQVSMGSLVHSFNNVPAWPYRRKSGLFTRLDLGIIHIETFAEEITHRALYGLRVGVSLSPTKKGFQIGTSVLVDMGLSREGSNNLPTNEAGNRLTQETIKDKWGYMVAGVDFRIPFIIPNQSVLNLIIDVNGIFFLEREPFGFYYGTFWHSTYNTLPGLGASLGIGGQNNTDQLLRFRYALSLQYQSFLVPPVYVTSDYDYMRLLLLDRLLDYVANPADPRYSTYTIAINADLGLGIGNWLDFQMFYSAPFSIRGSNFGIGENDFLLTSLTLGKTEWPVRFSTYLQMNQLAALFTGREKFLSIKNRIGASLSIQVRETLEFSFSGSTILLEDERGNLLFNDGFILGGSMSIMATLKL